MRPVTRVLSFLGGCAALFGVALGVGDLVGPVASEPTGMAGHGADEEMAGMVHHDVGGLEASADGYTLGLAGDRRDAGLQSLAFTVTGPDGRPVTAYDEQHRRDLHLVVVRRDLTGFQHVHPTLDRATGEWRTDVELTPGAWRVLADFRPTGAEQLVLGTDLLVSGDFDPDPLGEDSLEAHVDGYHVTLGGNLAAGEETVLTATVLRDGQPVTDLQRYLGSYGHLISLRGGDLGYLHVHPDEDSTAGPAVSFHTEFPTPGRYRLFLDFRHGGAVHTAAFTVTVGGTADGTVDGGSHDSGEESHDH